MNKEEIIEIVAAKHGITKVMAHHIFHTIFEELESAMQRGDRVLLKGFGTFCTSMAQSRTIMHPTTRQAITIEAALKPRFLPSERLKSLVAEPSKSSDPK